MLEKKRNEKKFACVGLDTDTSKISEAIERHLVGKGGNKCGLQRVFNHHIVRSTSDFVCAYKPNMAFYEAHGPAGIESLRGTIDWIKQSAPDVPVILDFKRADIDNTNLGTIQMAFDYLQVDAVTVNPYLGGDALQPFLERTDKGIFVLCKTSNKGSGEFQDIGITVDLEEGEFIAERTGSQCLRDGAYVIPFYQHVAYRVSKVWNKNNNCGLVVGATHPNELKAVRQIVGDMPILNPGIGAQGGDLEASVKAAQDHFIVNSARGIIFASKDTDFAEASRRETEKLHYLITQYLPA